MNELSTFIQKLRIKYFFSDFLVKFSASDGEEEGSAVVRKEKKTKSNPMVQTVREVLPFLISFLYFFTI